MIEITFDQLPKAVAQLLETVTRIEQKLDSQGNDHPPDTDELLTISQASEILTLAVPTLYGLVHRNEIPVCKKGKRLYFSKTEIQNWIKSGRKKTVEELTTEAETHLNNLKKKGGKK